MIVNVLLQTGRLTETQRAVRDRFQEGGSLLVVLLVLLAISSGVLAAYFLTRRQQRASRASRSADPWRLFRDLHGKLGLGSVERQVIETLAKDLRLGEPAVILLCPAVYDRCVDAWSASRERARMTNSGSSPLAVIERIRGILFPDSR